MVPVAGLRAQTTLVPEGKFSTENCWVFAGSTLAVEGLTVVVGVGVGVGAGEACSVKLALPRMDCVDEFVATTVTVVCAATVLGAV